MQITADSVDNIEDSGCGQERERERERERGSFCELHVCIFIHVCEGETAKPEANYTQSIDLHFLLQLIVGVFPCIITYRFGLPSSSPPRWR